MSSLMPRSRDRCDRDGRERFVDLEEVNVAHGQPGTFKRALDRSRRLVQQGCVGSGDHAVPDDFGLRFDAKLVGFGAAHQY